MNDPFSLKGKIIILTGGAGFLGAQYAQALRDAGAEVLVWDAVGAEPVDITDEAAVRSAVEVLVKKYGRIDVLINNAALNARASSTASANQFAPYEEYPIELWEKELKVNLTGMMICTKAVAPIMMKQKSGSIVNIASELSVIAHDHRIYSDKRFKSVAYTTTKSAVLGFTRQWAARLGECGVRVNALSPSGVQKESQSPEFAKRYAATTMLGRMATPTDLVGPLHFLCSDASAYMTGANLIVDGGRSAW